MIGTHQSTRSIPVRYRDRVLLGPLVARFTDQVHVYSGDKVLSVGIDDCYK